MLRPMAEADLDAVAALEPVLFGSGAWSRATYATELAHPQRRYVVVDSQGEVAGYAGVDLAEQASIMTIAVAPEHQRQGLGRALMTALLDYARTAGAAEVLLEVRADDAGAQSLYAAFGFTPIGRRRGYYQDADAITMRLRLRGPGPVGAERSQR